jgi:hypothetical protein
MTDKTITELHGIISKKMTVSMLKEIIAQKGIEVVSTNPNGYNPLKSDLVDAVLDTLAIHSRTGWGWHPDTLINLFLFPGDVREEIMDRLI